MRRIYRNTLIAGSVLLSGSALAQEFSPDPAGDPQQVLLAGDKNGDPLETDGPLAVCFVPGTPEAYIEEITARVTAINAGLVAQRYVLGGRWPGGQGAPLEIRWSFAPEGLNIPNQIGEGPNTNELFSRMDALFASQGGRARWVLRFEQSFARWSELTGLTYTRITNGVDDWDDGANWGAPGSATRGDVRIGMKPIDGSNGILAFNLFPTSGDMVLDRAESWGSTTNQNRFLRNTIMHEHGHGLGIAHVCSDNRDFLMEPALNLGFDGLRQDDMRAGQRHYGDVSEPDNSFGNPNLLGTLDPGDNAVNYCDVPEPQTGSNPGGISNCSIDADGENDWYQFELTGPAEITVVAIPNGGVYDDNAQAGNGSCPSGNDTDSGSFADLTIDIYESDGTTLIATADDTGKGDSETIAVPVTAGTYFVRIYETGTGPAQTQFYSLEIMTVSTTTCPSDLNGDGATDLSDLATLLGNFGLGGASQMDGDIDGDGMVGLSDLAILLAEFGATC